MVIDASVVVSHLVPHDVHHATSRAWLSRHLSEGGLVVAPAEAVLGLHAFRLVPMDAVLAHAAADLAGRLRLRGADAGYIAAAAVLRLPLVTWDTEQRERGARVVQIVVPGRAR
jgi:predicted nucleic acid-binding protein